MKRIKYYFLTLALSTFIFIGCEEHPYFFDDQPPAPPTGIETVTGDNRVDVFWNTVSDRDVAGYNVYFSYSYDGEYTLIGSTESDYFIDYDAVNGETYYYAVTAYDYNGNESDLSHDVIYDTPRPEGFNQVIFNYNEFPFKAGYDFSTYTVGDYEEVTDNYSSDIFFENTEGKFYLNVWDDSDIQDAGKTNDIYDISVAPLEGWAPDWSVPAIAGHTYVIRTWDNHYAKLRVNRILNDRVAFDWAYQTSETPDGYRELKANTKIMDRKPLNKEEMSSRLSNRNK